MKTDMHEYLQKAGSEADLSTADAPVSATEIATTAQRAVPTLDVAQQTARAEKICAALGGAANIVKLEPLAATRLRARLNNVSRLDTNALIAAGVPATQSLANGELDLIVGLEAASLARSMHLNRQ
jgi:PTS system glucose-specific IIC component